MRAAVGMRLRDRNSESLYSPSYHYCMVGQSLRERLLERPGFIQKLQETTHVQTRHEVCAGQLGQTSDTRCV